MKTTATIVFVSLIGLSSSLAAPVDAAAKTGTSADSIGWQFEYDEGDRVTKSTDPAGHETRFQYAFDNSKRLRKATRTAADGSSVIREFDDSGRLTSMKDSAGATSYGYDDVGRLNRIDRQGTPAVIYSYNTLDRVTRLQVGDVYRIEYGYDFLGRLESMTTPAGVIRYEYRTGQNQLVRTLPNGVKTIWTYAPNGQLRQIMHAFARDPTDGRLEVLAEYTYQYRLDGLIEVIHERSETGDGVKTYDYDVMSRLTRATGPSGRHYSYEYDLVGDRLKAVSQGNPPQIYSYDWAGA